MALLLTFVADCWPMNARLVIDVLNDDANMFDEDEFWLLAAIAAVEWTLLGCLLMAENFELVVVDKLDDVQIFITKKKIQSDEKYFE